MKSDNNRPAAIVFDLDGLLLDTEKISFATFKEACREYDYEPDLQVYYRCIGTVFARTREILREGYGPAFPLEEVCSAWKNRYRIEIIEKTVPLKPGVIEILSFLQSCRCPRAVVTSSSRENTTNKLDKAGITGYFSFILCGDQIQKGKPDPEIYLKACQKFETAPENCLALEDSDNGVLAAFRAGLKVIQVPDLLPPSREVRELGHPIVESLIEACDLLSPGFDQR